MFISRCQPRKLCSRRLADEPEDLSVLRPWARGQRILWHPQTCVASSIPFKARGSSIRSKADDSFAMSPINCWVRDSHPSAQRAAVGQENWRVRLVAGSRFDLGSCAGILMTLSRLLSLIDIALRIRMYLLGWTIRRWSLVPLTCLAWSFNAVGAKYIPAGATASLSSRALPPWRNQESRPAAWFRSTAGAPLR